MILHRGLLFAIYGLTFVLAVLTLVYPAPSVENIIGLSFTYLYGINLFIGALGCMWAIMRPNYRTELYFLWPVVTGYLMYDVALWALIFEHVDIFTAAAVPAPFGPAIAVAVLVLFLTAKIVLLYRKNTELIRAVDDARLG